MPIPGLKGLRSAHETIMPLRTKITLAFLLLFAGFIAGDYLVERRVTYRHFEELEAQLARRNLDRWVYAVENELVHLSEFAGDWTDWDDAYEFARTGDPDFVESNLSSDDWFVSFNLPVLAFYGADGSVVWERFADAETGERLELPALRAALSEGDRPLAVGDERPAVRGILNTRRGPLLVASRAIFRTDGTGPAQGFAVFGRFLDSNLARSIAKQTLVQGRVAPFDAADVGDLSPKLHRAILASNHDTVLQHEGGSLRAFALLRDVRGSPTILVRSDTPTAISAHGNYAIWISVAALGGAGLATMVLQFGFAHLVVVRPLQKLIGHAKTVGASGDLTARVGRLTNDEIGELGAEFDRMVEQLAASRTELVEQSRATGQAEVARSVTHNIGNVLNSAGVSLSTVQQLLQGLRTDGCMKAAELLETHLDDLDTFLRTDPRGVQLPKYLRTLAEHMEADRAGAAQELQRLQEQVRHMEEILRGQGEVARRGKYSEVVFLHEVIGRALEIVRPSYTKHGIEIEADLPSLPPVRTDPVELAQVLVNLFANAKDAMQSAGGDAPRLTVRLVSSGGQAVIEVEDTGHGLEPGSIERIFQAGYTTKSNGSGLGLHFCALSVEQLGGSIAARNAPAGTGAVFTIRIPVERVVQEHAAA